MGQPIIRYESGQVQHPFEAMSASSASTFKASFSPISAVAGAEPVVAPCGLLTGGAVTPDGTNDKVVVAALTAVMPMVNSADANGVISVASGSVTITRGESTDTHCITSITIDNTGALAAVAGTESTSFSETRGAAGGPPLIPVDSIEIAQVRTTSTTAALVKSSEIFAVPGLHVERADYPVYTLDYATGTVTFAADLPPIHTGAVPKKVYIKGATPLFAPIAHTSDWTPAEATYSINSVDTYDGPVGSASSSLGQASFTINKMKDGITDAVVALKGKNLWFEFRPDRDKSTPRQLTQGIFGISRSFPAGGGNFSASCTITPATESVDSTI